jgi:N-[(2S)-2-amino-2-carboxyethyl]-L-glutamate dehydrogenase
VYDPDLTRAERFCRGQSHETGLDVRRCESAEQAVRGAQVIVPATMAVEPTFDPGWLDEGVTIVLVSSLDGPTGLHALTDLLVVDDWEHESTHSGRYAERLVAEGLTPADGSGAVELAAVVAGSHPGRTAAAQRVVVSPVGLAMDDITTAHHVLQNADRLGIGTELRLRSGPPVWE